MKYIVFSILLFSGFSVISQNEPKIDSLNQVAKQTNASLDKANALLELSEVLFIVNNDTIDYLGRRVLKILDEVEINDKNDFEYHRIKADALNNIGYAKYLKGNLKTAINTLNEALRIQEKIGNSAGRSSVNNNLALIYANQGNGVRALDIYFENLSLAEEEDNDPDMVVPLLNIGYTYQLQKDYTSAIHYYQRLIDIEEHIENQIALGNLYNNLGAAYEKTNRIDSALLFHKKSLEIRIASNDMSGVAVSSLNLGNIYVDLDSMQQAQDLLMNALDLSRKTEVVYYESSAINGIVKLNVKRGLIAEANKYLPRLKQIWTETELPNAGINYASSGLLINKATSNWSEAFKFLSLKTELEDKIASQDMIRATQQRKFAVEFEKEKAERDLVHAEEMAAEKHDKEIAQERQTRLIIAIVGVSLGLILLTIVLILYYRNSKNKQRLTNEQLKSSILQEEKLKLENEEKSRELTGLSLRMTSSSQFVKEIDSIIQDSNDLNKEQIDDLLRNLQQKVRINARNEKDWEEFQRQFQGVHSDFIQRLKDSFPSLTQKEIRLCMLIKLNAGSDEIINLLSISKNTLKSSRHRINKKIGLKEGTTLYRYISDF